jgi:hypothetical protein
MMRGIRTMRTPHARPSNEAARSLLAVPVRTNRGTNAFALEQGKEEEPGHTS